MTGWGQQLQETNAKVEAFQDLTSNLRHICLRQSQPSLKEFPKAVQ